MQLRLLHVINNLSIGGAEVLLRGSLPLLRERGVTAAILVLSGDGRDMSNDMVEEGIRVLRSRAGRLSSPAQVPEVRRLLKSFDPDIVHVHLFPSLYWTALACPGNGPPMVYTEHSTMNRRRGLPFLRPVETLIYRRYIRIICISEGVRGSLLSWNPSLSRRAVVVHNGIDIQRIRGAEPANRAELCPGCAPGDRLLVMAASFTRKKDQATVIRTLGHLPECFRLVLPGDGPTIGEMKRLAGDLGLAARVGFPGHCTDIPGILKACDYGIQSSNHEGFGLAAVESMAAGIPLFASRIPGLSEVVGDAGILFRPGDHRELAQAILETDRQEGAWVNLSQKGMERAERFRIENMVEKLLNIYGSVLERA